MMQLLTSRSKNGTPYPSFWLRIIFNLIAVIVYSSLTKHLPENKWFSAISLFVILTIFHEYIFQINLSTSGKFVKVRSVYHYIAAQLLQGVLMMGVAYGLLLMLSGAAIRGELSLDFITAIILLNLFYIGTTLYYFLLYKQFLYVHRMKAWSYLVVTEISFIFLENGLVNVLHNSGKGYYLNTNESVNKIMNDLDPYFFCLFDADTIVNKKSFPDYQQVSINDLRDDLWARRFEI
jgi:hypothetical protein